MQDEYFMLCESEDFEALNEFLTKNPEAVLLKDDFGFTGLHIVASTDLIETAQVLISKGIDVNAINEDGNTALHIANYPEMTEFLIQNGANINAQNKLGNTPLLELCADQDGYDSMDVLLNHGADPAIKNKLGEIAKDVALARQDFEKLELF